ncbi:MAG: hypothetical protein H6754_03920 [Candidatus Omnitrophica bacterium]|nr:hypothetical protein [Candidatus Omnitrophota bacterium]
MNRCVILGLSILLAGCASVETGPAKPSNTDIMQHRFISLSQLRTGLTRAEVVTLLGKEIVMGYALVDEAGDQYKPITVGNPYRVEVIEKNKKMYAVDYYLIGIKTADDTVSDDELVPLIFNNDRLIGIGWDFFNRFFAKK